ncbi:MAG: hypothetical protein CMA31_04795 [Euryarchaeota archaeon]|nr:hypothetical protein [Euryarchaeota archaeon]
MQEFTDRHSVSKSLEFDFDSNEIWEIISEPGNLNLTHPFCESNEAFQWDKEGRSDRLVYLNGLNYIRNFITWDEGLGYTLLIGEEDGPKSYVVWEIDSLEGRKSKLTITVYPYILDKIPYLLAKFAHAVWVRPRLRKYLESVLSGYGYYLKNQKRTPRNHFGKHPWFS